MTETGHVLFLDLVGYSKLSLEDQARQVTHLLAVVQATPAFQQAERSGELVKVASGDGVALVFFRFPDAPVRCALEIGAAAPELPLRFGIHVGPVTRILDINGAPNVTGGGINLAKRVMDEAAAGEVLVSALAASTLREYAEFGAKLQKHRSVRTKHGDTLDLYLLQETAPTNLNQQRSNSESALDSTNEHCSGGALSPHSQLYIPRVVDSLFEEAIERRDSIVLIKGPRQVGKTSLVSKALHQLRQRRVAVAVLDLQSLSGSQLETSSAFYRTLAETIADALDIEIEDWRDSRAPNVNLERFLRRTVFTFLKGNFVLCIDEADRLFMYSYASEVFGLFRSWHNRRSLDPEGPWDRLTLTIAYATEAHLFIKDPNQSPFNVGTRLELADFTETEVAELSRRCGGDETLVPPLYALLSGQPYLTRKALDLLSQEKTMFTDFVRHASSDGGVFGEHLRRLLFSITQDESLSGAMRQLLRGDTLTNYDSFYRLRSAGVIVGESPNSAAVRCLLYQTYLESRL